MKIRFFNTYEPVTIMYRDLVPHLAQQGHQVELILSGAEYRQGRQLEQFLTAWPQVRIVKLTGLGLQAQQGSWAKGLIALLYWFQATLYTLFGPRVDRNIFLTQPPLIPLLGYFLWRVRCQPYYCVTMDLQPQIALQLGLLSPQSLTTRLLSWLSALALRQAAGVIAIGRCMVATLTALNVKPQRIHFIPNWVDEQQIRPIPPTENRLRQEQGWNEKFVVLYAGNQGRLQHFDDILAVAQALQDVKDLLFVFIGGGIAQVQLQAGQRDHHLANVVLLPFLYAPFSLADVLSAGDVHLVSLKEAVTGLAVPSKGYGIMAAGRPIIYQGSVEGEIGQVVRETGIGAVVPCGDVAALQAVILDYFHDRQTAVRQGRQARHLSETVYSRAQALARYSDVLQLF